MNSNLLNSEILAKRPHSVRSDTMSKCCRRSRCSLSQVSVARKRGALKTRKYSPTRVDTGVLSLATPNNTTTTTISNQLWVIEAKQPVLLQTRLKSQNHSNSKLLLLSKYQNYFQLKTI